MGDAKRIVVKPISSAQARAVVRRIHYSGKVVNNSTLHLGVFFAGRLEGAMQFGSPLDRRKVLPLVRGTKWNQMLELNRMAFSEALPRNSESRAMGVAFRMLRKHRSDIKWLLSFSDATQCGDGTIYRAAGFVLSGIKTNRELVLMPDGSKIHRMNLEVARPTPEQTRIRKRLNMPSSSVSALLNKVGAVPLAGYQFRYIKFLDPAWEARLTVPVIPFSKIPDDARMVRGEKTRQPSKRGTGDHPETGGAEPTLALHSLGSAHE